MKHKWRHDLPPPPSRRLRSLIQGAVAHRRTWQRRGTDRPIYKNVTPESDDDAAAEDDDDASDAYVEALRARRAQAVVKAGANGAGVPRILTRAAESNNVSALETLGMLKEMQGDHSGAFKAFKRSAMLAGSRRPLCVTS